MTETNQPMVIYIPSRYLIRTYRLRRALLKVLRLIYPQELLFGVRRQVAQSEFLVLLDQTEDVWMAGNVIEYTIVFDVSKE